MPNSTVNTSKTIAWFTHDLRLQDNAIFDHLAIPQGQHQTSLLCLFCIDPRWFQSDSFGLCSMGPHRWRFLLESLHDLDSQLNALGQHLVIAKGYPEAIFADLLLRYEVDKIVSSRQPGYNEQTIWQQIQRQHPSHEFITCDNFTLFQSSQLPFSVSNIRQINNGSFPTSFSKFRKLAESSDLTALLDHSKPTPTALPLPFPIQLCREHQFSLHTHIQTLDNSPVLFNGGERLGRLQLEQYFSSTAPSNYKNTRNALGFQQDDWLLTTKFSPWLANGTVSVRRIIQYIQQYERRYGANESTYWIVFELLWREYFQWYAHEHGARMFHQQGIQSKTLLLTFYPQRFQQWCQGNTPWPLVNACMKQLNQTGFLSNRGRQIVASCLIYELKLDWRCGAAYFEKMLIDYDVAANWGNWQYIAGVGADPRGGRHFNINKQQQQYDPDGTYIQQWGGDDDLATTIDNVDAVDWPIETLVK